MESIGSPLLWSVFAGLVLVALLVDLVLMRHGGAHKVTFKEALGWSAGWSPRLRVQCLALVVCHPRVRSRCRPTDRARVPDGYLVEKSLAVDNIFVFLMLFTYFAVPEEQRQKVLIIGVLGAIVLRAGMIFLGAVLLAKFHWILYVFGAFLLLTGIKMLWAAGKAPDLENNPLLRWLTAHVPMTRSYHGSALWIGAGAHRRYTPLFIVIIMIGITDLIFAVDSIPAIFAITTDPFIVLTSNVFAVLGLRAMFFMLSGMADRFHLLPYGLALVLMFIGTKMLLIDFYKVPVGFALGVVVAIIGATMVLSVIRAPRPPGDIHGP